MADNDASVASRATLSTLPLEIKSRICELAALQDERYKERWIPGALGEELIEVHLNEWRGRSLAALSETSKEFNELAAKHIFHTLTDTQIDSLEFTLVVLAQHSFRVRRVIIQRPPTGVAFDTAAAAAQRVFSALPLLPNLSTLHTTVIMVNLAVGDLQVPPEGGRQGVIRNAFRGVARRLRTVALVDLSTTDGVVTFLKTCSGLQELTISGSEIFDEPTGGLAEYLSTIPTLERLTLDATSAGSQGLHLTSGWPNLNKLSSLSLINIELEATSVAFINQHSPTLRHLTLRLPDESPPTPPPSFPTFRPLPQLSSFTLLNTSCDSYLAILAAVALATPSSATPSASALSHLSFGLKTVTGRSIKVSDATRSLTPFQSLRSLCVTAPAGGTWPHALASFKNKGVLSAQSPHKDVFTFMNSIGEWAQTYSDPTSRVRHLAVGLQHASLKEALAHGEQLADRYLKEGNLAGLNLMVKSMGSIWGDKLLQDD